MVGLVEVNNDRQRKKVDFSVDQFIVVAVAWSEEEGIL